MIRIVPADKKLPDDDFERLNICNRTSRHRAANPLCFARFDRQQNIHAASAMPMVTAPVSAIRGRLRRHSICKGRMARGFGRFGIDKRPVRECCHP